MKEVFSKEGRTRPTDHRLFYVVVLFGLLSLNDAAVENNNNSNYNI